MGRQSHHLAARVALVSGVARPPGIGRATALRLAAAGAHVVCVELVDRQRATPDTGSASRALFDSIVDEVASAGPGEVLALPMAGRGGWDGLVAAAVDRFGGLDICCALNGATGADAGDGPLLRLTAGSWRRCLDVNLNAPLELMTAAARAMVGTGRPGAIVALSSHAARAPAPGDATQELAEQIAAHDPGVIQRTKALLWSSLEAASLSASRAIELQAAIDSRHALKAGR